MEFYRIFHGIPWKFSWNSMENSKESYETDVDGIPWNSTGS
jgi:hypothetical protein